MASTAPTLSARDPRHAWFPDARYGLFLHWGPYARYARGEQVLIREMMDQRVYEREACAWNPSAYDAREWARLAVESGFRYAVLTTRHHDGYCLWDTHTTNYSSAKQAPKRDLVREFVEAFREAGLRVGLYYSWIDFRIPAMYAGPERDPAGWAEARGKVHAQVEELCTRYGKVDVFWFDGVWPRTAREWGSGELVEKMRQWQPGMMINNRLGPHDPAPGEKGVTGMEAGVNESADRGDFGTPEHHITAEAGRYWESCQVSTWRLWSHTTGDRWRASDQWLDMLTDASCKGGNLLLNCGPDAQGRIPPEFASRAREVGGWLKVNGEAIYGGDLTPCDVCETTLVGARQVRRGNTLYVICRFWHGGGSIRLAGLAPNIAKATLLGSDATLSVTADAYGVTVSGLPEKPPTSLFPVLKLECTSEPKALPSYSPHQWTGDPMRLVPWASARGTGWDV